MLPYTSDHDAFRSRLREFCDEHVVPYIEEWEKECVVDRDAWRKMGRAGFLCTAVDRQYGGMGGDFLYSVIVLEEIARTNHYGLDAFLHSDIVVPYIASFGSEEQKRKYLPGCVTGDIVTAVAMTEPGAGSDLAGMESSVAFDGDEVVLNGTKTFISNGLLCDLVVLAARDHVEKNRHMAISLFLVEDGTRGFAKGTVMNKMGVHSQDTSELFFQNCRVPKSAMLGQKGEGFLMLMQKLQQERLLVAILAVVKAGFALEWTIGWVKKQKKRFPSQAAQFSLAQMAADHAAGRAFVDELILRHMAKEKIDSETCMAKFWTTDMANRLISSCLDLVGQEATLEFCPLARMFRDLRVTSIFAGANEIMKIVTARSLLG